MPSVLGELSPGFDFPPACVLLCCGGVYGNIVSQPLLPALMWSSSHLTDVNMSLCPFLVVFFFFSEKIFPSIVIDSMCLWEEVRSRSF